MPGKYDVENREIILDTDYESEPVVTTATLIHFVVHDLLSQLGFKHAHHPELIELAVVVVGLGIVRSHIQLVNESGTFWDSTEWEAIPKPFLDFNAMAYAFALAAFARQENTPPWLNSVQPDLKRVTQKSIKYLFKTQDVFYEPSHGFNQTQDYWWELVASDSATKQVAALRKLDFSGPISDHRAQELLNCICSSDRDIVLHALDAVGNWTLVTPIVIEEIKELTLSSDDEIRAKAMCVLVRIGRIDDDLIDTASRMLGSDKRFVNFAGIVAVVTLEQLTNDIQSKVDQAFRKSLQVCDYEFIGLLAAGYNAWMPEPRAYLETILQDSPEYLTIANEALENSREQMAELRNTG